MFTFIFLFPQQIWQVHTQYSDLADELQNLQSLISYGLKRTAYVIEENLEILGKIIMISFKLLFSWVFIYISLNYIIIGLNNNNIPLLGIDLKVYLLLTFLRFKLYFKNSNKSLIERICKSYKFWMSRFLLLL